MCQVIYASCDFLLLVMKQIWKSAMLYTTWSCDSVTNVEADFPFSVGCGYISKSWTFGSDVCCVLKEALCRLREM